MNEELQERIRAWAKRQTYCPSLAAAVRRLVEIGLANGEMPRSKKGSRPVAHVIAKSGAEIVTTADRQRLMLDPSPDYRMTRCSKMSICRYASEMLSWQAAFEP